MKITIPTLKEDKIPFALEVLEKKGLLETKRCVICEKKTTKENIGGFVPYNGKVGVICDDPKCYLEAVSKIRKANGNGSL